MTNLALGLLTRRYHYPDKGCTQMFQLIHQYFAKIKLAAKDSDVSWQHDIQRCYQSVPFELGYWPYEISAPYRELACKNCAPTQM